MGNRHTRMVQDDRDASMKMNVRSVSETALSTGYGAITRGKNRDDNVVGRVTIA